MPLVLLVLVIVLVTDAAVTYSQPRSYKASVTMEVRHSDKAMNLFNSQGETSSFDPRFFTTQFEIIQRKEILYPVIHTMNLQKAWGMPTLDSTYLMLRQAIQIREVRNTELIEISVFCYDPNQAADIANAIADEYQRKRIAEVDKRIEASLKQLRDEMDKQKVVTESRKAEVNRIRNELDIHDLSPDSVEDPLQVESQLLVSLEQKVDEQRSLVSMLASRSEQLSKMADEEILKSAKTLQIDDQVIIGGLPELNAIEGELSRLSNSGLGARHPLVQSLEAKRQTLQQQLVGQVKSVRKAIESNLKIAQGELAAQESRVKVARDSQQSSKTRSSIYYKAKSEYIQARKVLESLDLKLTTERLQRAMPDSPTTIWEMAEPVFIPARPNVHLNWMIGVFVGLAMGVALAFFAEYLDTSLKTVGEVEERLQIPVLGVIPDDLPAGLNFPPQSIWRESFRIIRSRLEIGHTSKAGENVYAVVSSSPGEGKSSVATHLALSYAAMKRKVLIIDADMRRPSIHQKLGGQKEPGLSQLLAGSASLEEVVRSTGFPFLSYIAAGKLPVDPSGFLHRAAMKSLLESVGKSFDMVMVDTPPLLGLSDAAVICSLVDHVIVVSQHRRYPASFLVRAVAAANESSSKVVGVVINRFSVKSPEYKEYYSAYYSYYGATMVDKHGQKRQK